MRQANLAPPSISPRIRHARCGRLHHVRGIKTRCSGQWTEARYRSFVISLLRAGTMRWRPKHDAIKRAFIGNGPNPRTGRPCKLHRCERCAGIFSQSDMVADHRQPVVEPEIGFVDWNTYISRMFVESDAFDSICVTCHASITAEQNQIRALRRSQARQ